MKKWIIFPFLVVFVLSLSVLPASAGNVNYQVYAFRASSKTVSTFETHILTSGSNWVYNSTNAGTTFGYYIVIPPSTTSGYLIAAGYSAYASASTTSGWSQQTNGFYFASFATLSSSLTPTAGSADSDAWNGVIYIPAHTQTLYLVCTVPSITSSPSITSRGASAQSNAFIAFVPDTESSTTVLQQILTQVQNIKNEITSSTEDNQYSQEIVDQMDDLLEQIEDLTQQIEDVTVRPPPDTILPSPPADLLPPVDPAGQLGFEAVTSILSLPLILSFLLMVFTLALIRYVLFGKS